MDRGMGNGQRPVFFLMNEWAQKFVADVELLAEPLLKSEGMSLVDVEYRREANGRVLRVFIDKQGGVTLSDCALISNQLGDILDAKTDHDEPYRLEVSSPGLDRPLTKPKHFVYFEGRLAVVKTSRVVQGRKNFKGVLAGFSEGVVTLLVDDQPVAIPYETIVKARLDWTAS
jgi:ribosome maturation factor RimP